MNSIYKKLFITALSWLLLLILVHGQSNTFKLNEIHAGDTIVICENSIVQFITNEQEGYSYKWYPDSVFTNEKISGKPNAWTLPLQKTTRFTLIVTNKKGIELQPIYSTAIIQPLASNLDTIIDCCPLDTIKLLAKPTGGVEYANIWEVNTFQNKYIDSLKKLIITPFNTTEIKLIVTDHTTGCSAEGKAKIIVNRLRGVSIIATDSSICQKSVKVKNKSTAYNQCGPNEVWLSAATGLPGYTYLWSTGQTTNNISVYKPGTYSVTVSKIGGCSTTVPYVLDDCLNMRLEIIKTRDKKQFLIAKPHEMLYEWEDGDTAQFKEINKAGIYSVTVIDPSSGCEANDSIIFDNTLLDSILRIDFAMLKTTGDAPYLVPCSAWSNNELNELEKKKLESIISKAMIGEIKNYRKPHYKWNCEFYKMEERESFLNKKSNNSSQFFTMYFKKHETNIELLYKTKVVF